MDCWQCIVVYRSKYTHWKLNNNFCRRLVLIHPSAVTLVSKTRRSAHNLAVKSSMDSEVEEPLHQEQPSTAAEASLETKDLLESFPYRWQGDVNVMLFIEPVLDLVKVYVWTVLNQGQHELE